ncbi:DUF742 domain-containing protein [Actinocatenispora sera]|uniref:DUF742 domain-containing protein n=1 Tax=Actinocatenispora sera TaxID=390989 RepID=A0A810L499_9ACTN|nr:DUF742 domain-containing protein [Actinocatenispora sera]BCJ29462.1 hypothetical protein Asera_35700 [Actinocatenispora sera]
MTAGEPVSHRHRAPWPPDDAIPGWQHTDPTPPNGWQHTDPAAPNGWHHTDPAAPKGWHAGANGWAAGGAHQAESPGHADDDDLPIVAAYMVARGRVAATPYNRTATVYGRPGDTAAVYGLDPAHLRLLDLVNVRPSAVAEIAALMNVPVVAVRVLLDELVDRRLVAVTGPDGPPPSPAILVRALSGLRTI